ncbi:MAG: SNF2-related protein [Endozoicomonas sp.]
MAAVYGQTWWGEQWLAAFNGIDYSNRLPRGRRYAGNGSVRTIDVDIHCVSAKVQGRQRAPYRVKVSLPLFSADQCRTVLKAVHQNPSVLARLLNRQLPPQVLDLMEEHNIRLFPHSWDDMRASCSCPDWAMPCKHIAAVIYLIANEIDKNPFVIFQLHGMDLAEEIQEQTGVELQNRGVPVQVLAGWTDKASVGNSESTDHRLPDADLSTIPPLGDRIFSILSEKPLFHPKDFRGMLSGLYRRSAKEAVGWDREAVQPVADLEAIDRLTLVVDETGNFLRSEQSAGNGLVSGLDRLDAFLEQLASIGEGQFDRLGFQVRYWHQLYRLALKLVSQQAYIPAVYNTENDRTLVQWRPALLSEPVKALLEPLYKVCPPDLVVLEHTPKRKRKPIRYTAEGKNQVDAALHVLVSYFTGKALLRAPAALVTDDMCQLFAGGVPCRFDQFETLEYPKVIKHWLTRLYLGERPHCLHLIVEEWVEEDGSGDLLGVGILVEMDGSMEPLHRFLDRPGLTDARASVLADLAMLADYFPEAERLFSDSDDSELVYSLNDFTPVFRQILPALRMLGIRVILPKNLRDLAYPQLSLSLSSSSSDNTPGYLNLDQLLSFNWQVAVGDRRVSATEFRQLVAEASGLVQLMDQYVMLDDDRLQKLIKRLDDLPESLSRIQLLKAGLSGELDGAQVDLEDDARSLFEQLLKADPTPLPKGLNAELRPYQQRGFEWLAQNARTGFGSLIADDMGLGKTLQVIALLLHLKETGQLDNQKALVIVPTSLLTNWRKEIERFAPTLSAQIYHGSGRVLDLDAHDAVLTSYGLARSDQKALASQSWKTLVIDEAQNIKNPTSQQTKAVKQLKADIRVGMSGTPVENRLREYWSLFDFTNKSYLGTQKRFQEEYASPIENERDQRCLDNFRKVTAPFILRRLKTDKSIISDLPDKLEADRYCALSKKQASLYQSSVDSIMSDLAASDEGIERKGLIFKLLNALKQICNSPAQFLHHERAKVEDSGKLATFLEIMREADEAGEKALIFTQYTGMGELLAKSLQDELGMTAPFLHGGLSRRKRDEMVEAFQNDRHTRAMILSLKAGGTGLNLTAASQVIHYDLWWNPAVEAQATDRAYRIGQDKNVQVHRLITENTMEEKIDAMIQGKKELANLTVASGEQWITELSDKQIVELVSLQ